MKKRAVEILNYRNVDRMPAVHFGYWNELLAEWAEQGHISKEISDNWWDGSPGDHELDRLLGWDHGWVNMAGGNVWLKPAFEKKVIEKLPDGFLRVQTPDGTIERIREGAGSIPAEDDYLLKDRDAWEKLFKPKMQFSEDRIDAKFLENFNKRFAGAHYPIGLEGGSILGTIRNILTVVGLSYALCDDYDLVREIVDTFADMQYKVCEAVLKTGAKFDYAQFWEDICFKNGPLISPVMFDELCAHHYKKRTQLFAKYSINIVSLDCDGVTESLIKTWFDNGVNTLFPIEIGVWGDQFEAARKKYGKGLLGVGGMDKTAFRKDKSAVDKEIERMKRLAGLGGFLPCPDHRLMPGTKFELVQYYTDKIKQIKL